MLKHSKIAIIAMLLIVGYAQTVLAQDALSSGEIDLSLGIDTKPREIDPLMGLELETFRRSLLAMRERIDTLEERVRVLEEQKAQVSDEE